MRTTVDLPDELYRALKTRAARTGVTMRELIRRYIEQGLKHSMMAPPPGRREAPPVIIPQRGLPIGALSREELRRLEEQEDEIRHARPARR